MKNNEIAFDRRVVLERTLGLTALFGGIALLDVDAAAAQSGGATMPGLDMKPGVRRIITGHNAQGRSYIIKDDRITGGAFPACTRRREICRSARRQAASRRRSCRPTRRSWSPRSAAAASIS